MANDDVIVKFRADVSEMQSNIESAKKSVTDFSKETERAQNKIISANKKTASSFNGLGNSINQLTRELPAFTYSAQTGILALSNNIPMLADQIQMLKVKNQELVASGQKAIPVWKSLTSALFSWQTLLSVGVTLTTLYGGKLIDWIASLFESEKALKVNTEAQKQLNKVLQEANEILATNQQLIDRKNVSNLLDKRQTESLRTETKKQLEILEDREIKAIAFIKTTDAFKKYTEIQSALRSGKLNAIETANLAYEKTKQYREIERVFKLKTGLTQKEIEYEQNRLRGILQGLPEEIKAKEVPIKRAVRLREIELDGLEEIKEVEEEILFTVQEIADIDVFPTDEEIARMEKVKQLDLDRLEIRRMAFNEAINTTSNLLQATENLTQTEIDGIKKASDAKIQMLDKQLEQGIISQKKYDAEKEKIERNADARTLELRQKQAEREKIVASFQALLKGGLATLQAFLELGPVAGAIAAVGIASEVVAIQTAPIPQFEKGGWVKGKRHRDGGVLIEAEDKEFINNRISSQKYSEELESMNNLSFEKLNYRKHIMPAIRKEREKIYSAINSSFNDSNLLMSDRETRQILRDIRDGVKQNSGYSKSLRFK